LFLDLYLSQQIVEGEKRVFSMWGWRQETCEVEALVLALKKIGFFCDFCYVEMDRCTADAVAHVTGSSWGGAL
jgi:hypothetical protein